jgi:hypothetical protein
MRVERIVAGLTCLNLERLFEIEWHNVYTAVRSTPGSIHI